MTGPSASTSTAPSARITGARRALALLLAINLLNYIDRYILSAVEPKISAAFFSSSDPDAMAKTGTLATAFLVSYMFAAPLFGWIADRTSRWLIVALGVTIWSVASACSGLAATFGILLATRLFVGIGEAGYGPTAPTLISDFFPQHIRGRVMSFFYMAIPVGSALGYVLGGAISKDHGWRMPFYVVAPPGILLGALCFLMKDPRAKTAKTTAQKSGPKLETYLGLFKNRSYVINTLAMTAMTFAMGGLSYWAPRYISDYRHAGALHDVDYKFGVITALAGLIATLSGGFVADNLVKRLPGAYFITSGIGMFLAFPCTVAFLFMPFPSAWYVLFFAVFFLFFNAGPSNTALANVTHPSVRAAAFALNILIIHALGDAISPPLIGWIAGHTTMNTAFFVVAGTMIIASALWLFGSGNLARDTAVVASAELER